MNNGHVILPLKDINYREDLYPRIKADPATIQRYAENLDVLPPIEINQYNIIIDGFHRWTAHRKAEAESIKVIITETASEAELYGLAIRRNANHGLQLSEAAGFSIGRLTGWQGYAAGAGLRFHQR